LKKEYIIKNEGIRLDKAIAQIDKDISRMMVQKLIDEEKVFVNGKKEKASYKVKTDDKITLELDPPKEAKLKPEDIPLDVIYEDSDIIIINKEKGMVVHPGNGNPDGTLANAILARCKDSLSGIG
jgi:23S rRNA pseudouridine1911/1915/1917 synthase